MPHFCRVIAVSSHEVREDAIRRDEIEVGSFRSVVFSKTEAEWNSRNTKIRDRA